MAKRQKKTTPEMQMEIVDGGELSPQEFDALLEDLARLFLKNWHEAHRKDQNSSDHATNHLT